MAKKGRQEGKIQGQEHAGTVGHTLAVGGGGDGPKGISEEDREAETAPDG